MVTILKVPYYLQALYYFQQVSTGLWAPKHVHQILHTKSLSHEGDLTSSIWAFFFSLIVGVVVVWVFFHAGVFFVNCLNCRCSLQIVYLSSLLVFAFSIVWMLKTVGELWAAVPLTCR